MAQLTIEVNGHSYVVGCEDGQEAHLRSLAAMVDAQVRQVGQEVGQLGETRLMLMGALLLADELTALKARLAQAESETSKALEEARRVEDAAVAAIDEAARRLDSLG